MNPFVTRLLTHVNRNPLRGMAFALVSLMIMLAALSPPALAQNIVTNANLKGLAGWGTGGPDFGYLLLADRGETIRLAFNGQFYQDLATEAGRSYRLQFAVEPSTPDSGSPDSNVDVFWGDSLLERFHFPDRLQPKIPAIYFLQAHASSTRLRFVAKGFPNLLPGISLVPADTDVVVGKMDQPGDGSEGVEDRPLYLHASFANTNISPASNTLQFWMDGTFLLGTGSAPVGDTTWASAIAGTHYIAAEWYGFRTPAIKVLVNTRPKILFTSPPDRQTVAPGTSVNLVARVSNYEQSIARVRFLTNGVDYVVVEGVSPVLSLAWTPAEQGSYLVSAVGERADGAEVDRASLTIYALDPGFEDLEQPTDGSRIAVDANHPLAQVFTPGQSGILRRVELNAGLLTGLGDPLVTVAILDAPEGLPGANKLGEITLPLSQVRVDDQNTAVFGFVSNHISVLAGKQYALSLAIPANSTNQISFLTSKQGQFLGGKLWQWDGLGWEKVDDERNRISFSTCLAFKTYVTPVPAPTVSLDSPAPGAAFPASTEIPLAATASDVGETPVKVAFLANGAPIAVLDHPPFGARWTNAEAGSYLIQAVAENDFGVTRFSDPIAVTVGLANPDWPAIAVEDTVSPEGDRSIPPLVFHVTLSEPSTEPVTVDYSTQDLTATARVDYIPVSGKLTFPPGQVETYVYVRIVANTRAQAHRRVRLLLSHPRHATLGRPGALGTIVDDEPGPGKAATYVWSLGTNDLDSNTPLAATVTAIGEDGKRISDVPAAVHVEVQPLFSTNYTAIDDVVPTRTLNEGFSTEGYDFRPSVDIVVTHLRCWGAAKISLWDQDRQLLASTDVPYSPSAWREVPLPSPVPLRAGTLYRIAAYSANTPLYIVESPAPIFPHGQLEAAYTSQCDQYPSSLGAHHWRMVDFRYFLKNPAVIEVDPHEIAGFTNGLWSGQLRLKGTGSPVRLAARDIVGKVGFSTPFSLRQSEGPGGAAQTETTPAISQKSRMKNVPAVRGGLPAPSSGGTPFGWGNYDPRLIPQDGTNYVAIDANAGYTIALRSNGTVEGWGTGSGAQIPVGMSNIVAISAGYDFGVALDRQGHIATWGAEGHVDRSAILTPPVWLTNAVAVSAGYSLATAITEDGYIIAWGSNASGALDAPYDFVFPRGTASGQQSSLAIRPDGIPTGWGLDYHGIFDFPAGLTNAIQVDKSPFFHAVALNENGTVYAWGDNSAGQTNVPPGLAGATQVASGSQHTLALLQDGSVAAWGGNGADFARPPANSLKFFAVSAGDQHSIGLTLGPVPRSATTNRTVPAGVGLALERQIIGATPFVIQWLHDGQPIESATNQALALADAQGMDSGNYTLSASNAFGRVESAPIYVNVQEAPPSIVTPPVSVYVAAGGEAVFTVEARGTEPLLYQWLWNGNPLPGETNPTLRIPRTGTAQDGEYRVAISNAVGSVTSPPAQLSSGVPRFTQGPESKRIIPGMSVEFSASVVAAGEPAWQWWFNGRPLAGETLSKLHLEELAGTATGDYFVVASNSYGSATSRVARIDVRVFPEPLSPPSTVVSWSSQSFQGIPVPPDLTNATAIAAMPFTGLALRDDGSLAIWKDPFETGLLPLEPLPEVNQVVAIAGGYWHWLALQANGTVVGKAISIAGTNGQADIPPGLSNVVEIAAGRDQSLALRADGSVVTWPDPLGLPPGLDEVVAIAAQGSAYLAQRADGSLWFWQYGDPHHPVIARVDDVIQIACGSHGLGLRRDGSVFSIDLEGVHEITPPTEAEKIVRLSGGENLFGALDVNGRVFDLGGHAWLDGPPTALVHATEISYSYNQSLALTPAPFITSPPEGAVALPGTRVTLSIAAKSSTPLRYQWLHDGMPVATGTGPVLDILPVTANDAGTYVAILENSRFAVTSAPAVVTVVTLPQVTAIPNSTAFAGTDFAFTAIATGTGPFRYQWNRNSQPMVGARSISYAITNIQAWNAGEYSVTVSNPYGSTTSEPGVLTVQGAAPLIVEQPVESIALREGANLSLEVMSRGSEPMTVTWWHGDQRVAGGDGGRLVVREISTAGGGDYLAVISNDFGMATSHLAQVLITPSAPAFENLQTWRVANSMLPFSLAPETVGTRPIQFQWRKEGVAIPGKTNAALTWKSLSLENAGFYTLSAVNALGVATTDQIKLVVLPGTVAGVVVGWGALDTPRDLGLVQAMAAGPRHVLVVRPDGTVAGWGMNNYGQLSIPAGLNNAIQVAAGGSFSLALRNDGTIAAWGTNNLGQLDVPASLDHVVAIAAGDNHGIALREDGTVAGWGAKQGGALAFPTGLSNVVQISAAGQANGALLRDGRVKTWGSEAVSSRPSLLTNAIAVAVGNDFGLALRSDHTLTVWEGNWGPIFERPPVSTSNITAIAAGATHNLVIYTNGTVAAWRGRAVLGLAPPAGLSNVVAIRAGSNYSLAITLSPIIVSQPADTALIPGQSSALSIKESGAEPLNIQWFLDGQPMEGETNRSIGIIGGPFGSTRHYSATVRNSWGSVTSRTALVTSVGPIEFRWAGSNPDSTVFFVRAPGLEFAYLSRTTNFQYWTPAITFIIPPGGTNVSVPNPPIGSYWFYRLNGK